MDCRIQNEIKRLDEKIDFLGARFGEKMDSLRNQIVSEIKRLDERIDSLDVRLEARL